MQRKIYSRMKAWNDSDDRKPLMIMGPRQVGKTYSATRFARENYGSYVLFNFQESIELHRIFDGDLDPRRLIRELSAYSQETIDETVCHKSAITSCRLTTSRRSSNSQCSSTNLRM